MTWTEALGGAIGALALAYLVALVAMLAYARRHPGVLGLRDTLRFVPDLLVLLKRILGDRATGLTPRILVVVLLLYLVCPIDLVPDFIPVIGYADDVLVVAWILRLVVRSAGPAPLRRHWPGNDAGLSAIERLAGLPGRPPESAEAAGEGQ
ncbi:YkvA family protein [Arthrobacter sp. JSM 101049]|uniref:YkvA family protein n=1 Tax=Arthrobacter sp. JSM 101049 TaxID=929097 RepID=UPI003569F12E